MSQERMKARGVEWKQSFVATLQDYKLVFNKTVSKPKKDSPILTPAKNTVLAELSDKMAFANVEYKKDSVVEGVVYLIDRVYIEKLDKYEGVNKPIPNYTRVELKAKKDGEDIPVWVYVANKDLVKDGLKPTKEYMNHLLGGRDMLSKEWVLMLENIQTID